MDFIAERMEIILSIRYHAIILFAFLYACCGYFFCFDRNPLKDCQFLCVNVIAALKEFFEIKSKCLEFYFYMRI